MKKQQSEETILDLDGRAVPLRIRRNRRARRIILRTEPARGNGSGDGIVVTLPPGADTAEAITFARRNAGWVRNALAAIPPRSEFDDGAAVPVLGVDYLIRHVAGARRGVWVEDGEVRVSGRAEHVERRVRDWLKKEARRIVSERVREKTAALGLPAGRISVRDTRSRWGSCASNGNLSFSWRLVMAPEFVLDYVVAHEVAHLAEHNHGPLFWKIVGDLTDDVATARRWLRRHGESLHRYG